jgi:hypothetical protein
MSTEDPTPDLSRPSATLQASADQPATESGELIPMSFPGARRFAGWLFWVIFPVLCVVSIVFVFTAFAGHVGKRPDGIKGTLVVTGRTCSKKICSVGGTFTSDDGALIRPQLLADPRWHAGEKHRVVYDGKGAVVIPLPAYWDSTTIVIAGLGALTYLGAVGYFARSVRRERQT